MAQRQGRSQHWRRRRPHRHLWASRPRHVATWPRHKRANPCCTSRRHRDLALKHLQITSIHIWSYVYIYIYAYMLHICFIIYLVGTPIDLDGREYRFDTPTVTYVDTDSNLRSAKSLTCWVLDGLATHHRFADDLGALGKREMLVSRSKRTEWIVMDFIGFLIADCNTWREIQWDM